MKNKKNNQKITALAIIIGGVILLSSGLLFLNPLEKWQLKLTNHLYNRDEPSKDIIIVGIDEKSLNDQTGLGRFQNWDRAYYAQAIENLERQGAAAIFLDVLFPEKSRGLSEKALLSIMGGNPSLTAYFTQTSQYLVDPHPSDQLLAKTLQSYDNIVLLKFGLNTSTKYKVFPSNSINLFSENSKQGWGIFYPDIDDVIRRIPYKIYDTNEKNWSYSAAFEIFQATGKTLPVNLESKLVKENMLINFANKPYQYSNLSFIDIYNNNFKEEDVKNKIVLIGPTAEKLKDGFTTPTLASMPMPGVQVHANAIQTILEQKFLTEQSAISQITTITAVSLLLGFLIMFLGIIPGIAITAGTITAYQLSAQWFFNHGFILNLVYPTIAFFTVYLTITLYKTFTETREKAELRTAFGKYVNKNLVEKIIENPNMLKLGGEKRLITVFFSDIANFTTFSEQRTPDALVAQLNEYFEVMASLILKNEGNLNKFDGDAIMAFWGAPLDQPDHALLAAKSTLECRIALRSLHEKWKKENKPLLDFRVGLATGEVIAGNVGSKERFDYTVMGDIVNLGSRLEGANKIYGTHMMMSGATLAALGDTFEVRRLDRLRVKGKKQPVDIFELLTPKGQLSQTQQTIVNNFHQALEFYRNGQFEEAKTHFLEIAQLSPEDGPTQTYLKRCDELKQNPPQNWDGTWTLDHK
ncbi:MAG: adenylate cyclase, adenylate cyclase [Candidatus Peregrinibacteria bacterium GW2011_GWF2_39_17]|nr:MAG: adenylate cyclase, adenylate cyclase [Candidatus Peregrinibacteria bacterium GW2011_GWF2_39_17]HCW32710.1 hypothetical protein [Candidatus Peregrinibacteria bacterium]